MSPEASGGRFTNNDGGIALEAQGNGQGRTRAALVVDNYNDNQGMAAYLTNHSQYATAHFSNSSWGEVLYLQNGKDFFGGPGGPFIKAVNKAESDTKFLVDFQGAAWSDVGFSTPAADLAELMPAVEGLEPGDVLAIGSDGLLVRSRRRGQRSVAGVYSSRPGFVGGQAASEPPPGLVPLAIAGIVPVKATSEGGPICAGDLLVASSLPGHAMRARRGGGRGASLGRALEPLLASRGVIRMLVLSH